MIKPKQQKIQQVELENKRLTSKFQLKKYQKELAIKRLSRNQNKLSENLLQKKGLLNFDQALLSLLNKLNLKINNYFIEDNVVLFAKEKAIKLHLSGEYAPIMALLYALYQSQWAFYLKKLTWHPTVVQKYPASILEIELQLVVYESD